MIVQVYRNIEEKRILLFYKSHSFDKDSHPGYEFVEKFESMSLEECNRKINEKYFNGKIHVT
jgi:hypothetical protein